MSQRQPKTPIHHEVGIPKILNKWKRGEKKMFINEAFEPEQGEVV